MASLSQAMTCLEGDQRHAVTFNKEKPLLISAGAGSGKTRVLTLRMAYLLSHHQVDPSSILALTFTKKACQEMYERVVKMCPADPFVLDGASQSETIKECIEALNLTAEDMDLCAASKQAEADDEIFNDPDEGNGGRNSGGGKLHNLVSYFSGVIKRTRLLCKPLSSLETVERDVYVEYERRKRERNSIDFDDFIPLTLKLFACHSSILAAYRRRYQYVFVDEVQDVSKTQMKLLQLLVNPEAPRVTACGDQDQSIYGFLSGTKSQAFDEFLAKWPQAEIVKLHKNFRSTNTIVKAAAAIISNNKRSRTSTETCTSNGEGSKIVVCSHTGEDKEVLHVVEEIQRCRSSGVPYRQMAVLFRVRTIGRAFQLELARRKIPTWNTAPEWQSNPYKKTVAMDIIAYLRIALCEWDEEAFSRVLNKPARGLGKTAQEKIQSAAAKMRMSRMTAAKALARAGGYGISKAQQLSLKRFISVIDGLQCDVSSLSAGEVILKVYERAFAAATGSKTSKNQEEEQMTKLMAQSMSEDVCVLCQEDEFGASGAAGGCAAVLKKFVEALSGGKNVKQELVRDVVTLSTIHQAKGLEFDNVWLVRMNDHVLPLPIRAKEEEEEEAFAERKSCSLEEERRLAYVGVSRARKQLQISWIHRDDKTGEQLLPSRFLDEIPAEHVQSAKQFMASVQTAAEQQGHQAAYPSFSSASSLTSAHPSNTRMPPSSLTSPPVAPSSFAPPHVARAPSLCSPQPMHQPSPRLPPSSTSSSLSHASTSQMHSTCSTPYQGGQSRQFASPAYSHSTDRAPLALLGNDNCVSTSSFCARVPSRSAGHDEVLVPHAIQAVRTSAGAATQSVHPNQRLPHRQNLEDEYDDDEMEQDATQYNQCLPRHHLVHAPVSTSTFPHTPQLRQQAPLNYSQHQNGVAQHDAPVRLSDAVPSLFGDTLFSRDSNDSISSRRDNDSLLRGSGLGHTYRQTPPETVAHIRENAPTVARSGKNETGEILRSMQSHGEGQRWDSHASYGMGASRSEVCHNSESSSYSGNKRARIAQEPFIDWRGGDKKRLFRENSMEEDAMHANQGGAMANTQRSGGLGASQRLGKSLSGNTTEPRRGIAEGGGKQKGAGHSSTFKFGWGSRGEKPKLLSKKF